MNQIPTGQEVYNTDHPPVLARGFSYSDDQLDEMLQGPVQDLLTDTQGTEQLEQLLSTVVSTDFEREGLDRLLRDDVEPENWRVGEAIAEGFVADHGDCVFPWPTGRDLKNPEASPAGCDLTGFQSTGDAEHSYRFAFGEVKTSDQAAWPPGVVYGRHGLQKQLEGLRDDRKIKDALCRYLGHHAPRTDWEAMYQSAAKRYLQSDTEDVSLYGVLVRDVGADQRDLARRATALAEDLPEQTTIELYALYLPQNCIGSLSDRAAAANNAKGAE